MKALKIILKSKYFIPYDIDFLATFPFEIAYLFLLRIGYDESCLKKSICELARHPLHNEDKDEHLLMDVINFMLT